MEYFFGLSGRFGSASVQQHVGYEGRTQTVASRISEVNAANAESRSNTKKAGAGKHPAIGAGKKVVDLHLDRGDWALSSEMAVQRHADRRIGQGGRDASVSHGKAIGQLGAQSALDGNAVTMDAGQFYSE
jgi:hypothetical protein